MKTIKEIVITFALISIFLISNGLKAQSNYKANADTARFSAEFFMLAKTIDNTVYYTLELSSFKSEFENLYLKDYINKAGGLPFKTISFENGVEAVYAVDKKYATYDVLHYFANARKMTRTENYVFSDIEKQDFIKKVKETNNIK